LAPDLVARALGRLPGLALDRDQEVDLGQHPAHRVGLGQLARLVELAEPEAHDGCPDRRVVPDRALAIGRLDHASGSGWSVGGSGIEGVVPAGGSSAAAAGLSGVRVSVGSGFGSGLTGTSTAGAGVGASAAGAVRRAGRVLASTGVAVPT